MNKNLHRIVFNAARGARMVVQETARSAGKAASGATSVPPSGSPPFLTSYAGAVLALSAALFTLPLNAQIAGDPSAPGNQRPTVLTAPNGVPLVNIQTPSAAGVSRNTYRQFDVGPNGAILNNSRTNVQTQLGGYVQGNPWLARGPARIILNEVNSSNPSQLRGYVEVAGQRAEVIVANPAGIQVNGGGFINASRATLTTGVPQFNAAGSLESFLVRGGTVSVDGAGLDASTTDYAAILARAVQANAGIWAKDLKVVAGANQVTADASSATPTAGSGAAPAFALDVAQLGGMYAGKITLIGTEAGVGVRNAGSIGAGAGGLVVTAEGRLENTGTLEGARIELASASDIDNRGGTIRQTGSAALSVQAPTLSNTNGGVIGAEPPAPPAPPEGGSGSGGGPGGAEGSSPPQGSGGDSQAGESAGGGAPAAPAAPAPAAPPAPGTITAASTILNDGGRIYAGGPISLQTPNVNNSGGTLNVADLAVSGPRFSNAGGTLQVTHAFSARVDQFDNSGGDLRAGTMDIHARGDVINAGDGQLRSEGDMTLRADGMLLNAGSITAGHHLKIDAGSVQSDTASTLGAGVHANGQLASEGDLHIGAVDHLVAQGRNIAAGAFVAQGASVDLSSGHTSGASIQLHATQGDVLTRGATVATAGSLSITALNTGATWDNDAGTVQAGEIQLAAANIRNRQGGEIVQTGASSLRIAAQDAAGNAGTVDNSGGRIASNGQDLELRGAAIANTGGKIEHAATDGTLSLTAGSYSGADGAITANGALVVGTAGALDNDAGRISAQRLDIQAGSLSNRGGEFVQIGGEATRIAVAGALDNAGGTIASNANSSVRAGSLNNQGGTLRTAGEGHLTLAVASQLDNSAQGSITSAGQATLQTGTLTNDAGSIVAVQDLTLDVQGDASNVAGSILTNSSLDLSATALDNSRGTVAAIEGDLGVATSGALTNTEGSLQAGGQTQLTALGGLDNTQGKVSGQQLRVDTGTAQLTNTRGTMVGVEGVRIDSGRLNNDAGLIQSGGALAIDTQGQHLSNRNAAGYDNGEGGISSAGAMTLATGALDNSAGFIGAGGDLKASTQGVTNAAGGLIQSVASVEVQTGAGTYDTRAGQTLSGGDLRIAGQVIDNAGGLIRAQGGLNLVADRIGNAGTLGASTPQEALNGTNATAQGIEGKAVAITTGALDNSAGAIRAGTDARITSGGQVDNTGGLIAANGEVAIIDANAASATTTKMARTLAVTNNRGLIVANELLALDAQSLGGDGTLTSGKDLSITLQGDFANTGELSANNNLTLSTAGNITNSGKITAGDALTVSGQDIDNTSTGEMSALTTKVRAAGTLTNRGLIDGDVTQIDAGTLTNIGTGRIYGRELSIAAGTVNNLAETVNGETHEGAIAARERLDIGAGTINNRDGALIYSDGDLGLGGALDGDRRATGSASALNNHAATIESARDMSIAATQLNNTNGGVTWTMVPGESKRVVEYSIPGSGTRYDASEVVFVSSRERVFDTNDPYSPGNLDYTYLVVPAPEYPASRFRSYYHSPPKPSQDYTVLERDGNGADAGWKEVPVAGQWYARTDPIWATFGIAPPPDKPDNPFQYPGVQVGDQSYVYYTGLNLQERREIVFDHPATQAELELWQAYNQAYGQAHAALDAEIGRFIQSYEGNILTGQPSRKYSTWDAYDLTISSTTPVLQSSAPGQIIAGGKMDLTVGAGRNELSQILAGGNLRVLGGTIVNDPLMVDGTRETHGKIIHSYEKSHSFGDDERLYQERPHDLVEPTTVKLAAGKVEGNQAVNAGKRLDPLATGQASATAQGGGSVNASTRVNPILEVPSAVGGGGAASGQGADGSGRAAQGANLVVRTSVPNTGLPTASLFGINPGGRYLVETDPRFANYRNWLSSDYLLNNLGLDPNTTQKRLGDGFYEQRLIREQIAKLTGFRYLGDYTSDEEQYAALMNAGATFAKQHGLRPGIALTPAQMAQLTSDIVWLVEQSVTLPDGSVQKVLVPQVYVRVKPGDIDGSGALLSGKNVDMQLTGDVINGGTIAGRQAVSIAADNIHNLGGRITGGSSVDLLAKKDINVIGGRVEAGDRLTAIAGRDIRVESTTRSASSSASGVNLGTTYVDRVAGLYVTNPGGQLVAAAGRDITVKGAEVKSGGGVLLDAGRDLKLETVTTGSQQDIRWSATNGRQEQSTREVGSTIEGAGDVTLNAGRDLTARAATISAGEDATLRLQAGRDLTLEAGVNEDSAQTQHKTKSGMKYFSLDASSQETSLAKTTLSAGRIETSSGGDTTLSAIEANANSMDIQAGGKLILETASTVEEKAQHVTHGSSASVGAKGKGSMDETRHYNQLNVGSLAIDAKGGIQAQVGQNVNLQDLAQQPGMGWVNQIRNDPKLAGSVEWQRVQEAHEKWDYRQSGMGPVSAALVAVMVAAAALPAAEAVAGVAAEATAFGGYGATSTLVVQGAVQAGVMALSSQVGVSFFNNNGDLGKVFKELGESDSVKNLAAAIITGGVLAGMGFQAFPDQPNLSSGAQEFGKQLVNNLQIQGASTLINTTIKGGSFEQALQDVLLAALVNSIAATTANGIGNSTQGLANKLAHAIAGCALGAAHSGSSGGCAGGAIGAAIGEMFAEGVGDNVPNGWSKNDIVYLAGQFAGLAAALAGGDAEQIATANWAGSNAAANNRYGHSRFPEAEKAYTDAKLKLTAECGSTCTEADFRRIDAQAALAESAATKIALAQRGGLTTEQAQQLAQTLIELAPGFGSAESMLQLVTGQSSLTGEDASRIWAAVGLVPIAGGMVRKVGEPAVDMLAAALKASGNAATISFPRSQLQHGFKHAQDFGVSGNMNNQTLSSFQTALETHMASSGTQVVQGTYRGQPVTHFVDPATGLNVIQDASGNFLSAWKLSPAQLQHVLSNGKLGGG